MYNLTEKLIPKQSSLTFQHAIQLIIYTIIKHNEFGEFQTLEGELILECGGIFPNFCRILYNFS